MEDFVLNDIYVELPTDSNSFLSVDEIAYHKLEELFKEEDEETEFYGFYMSDTAHEELRELFQTDDDESDFEGFNYVSDLNSLFLDSDNEDNEFLGF